MEELEPEFELHIDEWEENRINPQKEDVDVCDIDDDECLACGS